LFAPDERETSTAVPARGRGPFGARRANTAEAHGSAAMTVAEYRAVGGQA
jgi:hypothetical protein